MTFKVEQRSPDDLFLVEWSFYLSASVGNVSFGLIDTRSRDDKVSGTNLSLKKIGAD